MSNGIKINISILLAVIIPSLVYSEESFFPYFYKISGNSYALVMIDVTEENIYDCIYWYDYYFYQGYSGQVKVATDFCIDNPDELLPNITAANFQSAAQAAIGAWNAIVTHNLTQVFVEDNSSGVTQVVQIKALRDWNEKGYTLSESGATEHALTLEEDNSENEFNDIWGITYYNSNYENDPGYKHTIFYLNASDIAYFTWVWNSNPGSGEVDVQQIMTHELGHILGYGDDTNSFDGIETLMNQGTPHISRCVEQELRNSYEVLYQVDTTSPILDKGERNE